MKGNRLNASFYLFQLFAKVVSLSSTFRSGVFVSIAALFSFHVLVGRQLKSIARRFSSRSTVDGLTGSSLLRRPLAKVGATCFRGLTTIGPYWIGVTGTPPLLVLLVEELLFFVVRRVLFVGVEVDWFEPSVISSVDMALSSWLRTAKFA